MHRVRAKLGIDAAFEYFLKKYQMHLRRRSCVRIRSDTKLSVYYNLRSIYTHPYIRARMYGHCAPVHWANYDDAVVSHFLQKPERVEKPYLVEPNDQILTLGVYFGAKTPFEIIKRLDDIKALIASKNFKGILIGDDGLADQFHYYFGSDLIHKLYKYPQMRCIPQVSSTELRSKQKNSGLKFIFLASDSKLKATDLLIESWSQVQRLNGASLTIACSNLTSAEISKVKKIPSISIVNEAPLSEKRKRHLLAMSDISICLTHVDGGANAFEGIEYGHAIITNTYQRSSYLTKNKNGVVVHFPNEFYRVGQYGVRFNSISDYLDNVALEVRQGKYDDSMQSLAQKIQMYVDYPAIVHEHSERSLELAHQESVQRSNEHLMKIYRQAIL